MPTQVRERTAEVYYPTPHKGQIAVASAAEGKRTLVLNAGRRWRKTTLIVPRCIRKALRGRECLIAAPVYAPHLLILWREMLKCLDSLRRHRLATFNKTEMTVTFEGLGLDNIIWFRSLEDPDNARGPSASEIFVDEAGLIQRGEEAYNETLRPMLLDHPDGHITLSGTPKGHNWFRDAYMRARQDMEANGDSARSIAFQIPSLGAEIVEGELVRKPHPYENPNLQWEDLLWEFQSSPERAFRQEYLAEFIADAGAVFNNVSEAIMRGVREMTEDPLPGHQYQIGVDIGRIHDFTVITAVRVRDMKQVYWKRINQVSWERIYNEVVYASRQYHGLVVLDATGAAGDSQTHELTARGVAVQPVKFNQYTKRALIDNLAVNIEQCADAWLLDIPQQTRELIEFEYQETQTGASSKMSAPKGEGHFDDCVTALALACHELSVPRRHATRNETGLMPATDEPSQFAGTFLW